MGTGLAQRGLGCSNILARRFHRSFGSLQAGDRIVLCLFAHDPLLGQGDVRVVSAFWCS